MKAVGYAVGSVGLNIAVHIIYLQKLLKQNIMKFSNYDNKPDAIEAVGDGRYYYRWDIEKVTESNEEHTRVSWNCYEVVISVSLTANAITKAVINALWGDGVEQKLLNDYYAFTEGVESDEAQFKQPYVDFLAERKSVKQQIANDFAQWLG